MSHDDYPKPRPMPLLPPRDIGPASYVMSSAFARRAPDELVYSGTQYLELMHSDQRAKLLGRSTLIHSQSGQLLRRGVVLGLAASLRTALRADGSTQSRPGPLWYQLTDGTDLEWDPTHRITLLAAD